MGSSGIRSVTVKRVSDSGSLIESDALAVEEPLEIRLGYVRDGHRLQRSLSITMRTPGQDTELAVGFLLTEGIISDKKQIETVRCAHREGEEMDSDNKILIDLKSDVSFDMKRLERHFYTTSSCGVCGKSSLEALNIRENPELPKRQPVFSTEIIHCLPAMLRKDQSVFSSTGGIHAAGLFNSQGSLVSLKEDVGRHNAVDKLIGEALLKERLPLHDSLMMVSGRTSFEILQKALSAGIPIVAAVGAPSSLAVELANTFKMTLLGFVSNDRFNIYSESQRILDDGKV